MASGNEMRPGNLLIRLAIIITASALLIPLFTVMVFIVAGAAAMLAAAACAEALMLRELVAYLTSREP